MFGRSEARLRQQIMLEGLAAKLSTLADVALVLLTRGGQPSQGQGNPLAAIGQVLQGLGPKRAAANSEEG